MYVCMYVRSINDINDIMMSSIIEIGDIEAVINDIEKGILLNVHAKIMAAAEELQTLADKIFELDWYTFTIICHT
jgi:hypothetical protein